jgi:hypothetical protein
MFSLWDAVFIQVVGRTGPLMLNLSGTLDIFENASILWNGQLLGFNRDHSLRADSQADMDRVGDPSGGWGRLTSPRRLLETYGTTFLGLCSLRACGIFGTLIASVPSLN